MFRQPTNSNIVNQFDAPPLVYNVGGTYATAEPMVQEAPLIKTENNIGSVLATQETLFLDDVFSERENVVKVPDIIVNSANNQFVEWNLPLTGFVKMDEIKISFNMPLVVTSVTNPPSGAGPDETSNFTCSAQCAYTFLSVINEIRAFIGSKEQNLFPDPDYCTDNSAWKAHMVTRVRSPIEDKLSIQNGLPCSKTAAFLDYENMNSKSYGDSLFYRLLSLGNQSTTTNITKTFTVKLADLVPWFDTSYYLRPNLPIKIRMYFKTPENFSNFTLSSTNNGIIGLQNRQFPVDIQSVKMNYVSRRMYGEKYDMFKAMPRTIINTYSYYKFVQPNPTPVGNYYVFDTWIKQRPTSILVYFLNETEAYSLPGTNRTATGSTFRYYTANQGCIAGLNIQEVRVYISSQLAYNVYGLDTNVTSNTFTLDMSASSNIMNEENARNDTKQFCYNYNTVNLNMVENIQPLQFYLNRDHLTQKNIRSADTGLVNIRVEIKFANQFLWVPISTGTGVQITGNVLPPRTTINYLLKYPYQVLVNQDNSASLISYPYIIGNDNTNPVLEPSSTTLP
jgi:hypothetical protein